MPSAVVDASALLVLLTGAPGAEKVGAALPHAVISSLSMSEVVAKLSEAGMPEEAIRDALQGLPLTIHPFDTDQAYEAGLLPTNSKRVHLSLGDKGCLSLARKLDIPAITADKAWDRLPVGVGVTVEVIG